MRRRGSGPIEWTGRASLVPFLRVAQGGRFESASSGTLGSLFRETASMCIQHATGMRLARQNDNSSNKLGQTENRGRKSLTPIEQDVIAGRSL